MVIPLIIVVAIPIFFGIVYSPPFDLPEEFNDETISEPHEFNDEAIPEEPDMSILHFVLMVIWIIFLLRILLQVKKGTFKATQRY
ncbi:MAG: hypothetical protein ACE5DT_05065 [Nitrosopumilus sp.]